MSSKFMVEFPVDEKQTRKVLSRESRVYNYFEFTEKLGKIVSFKTRMIRRIAWHFSTNIEYSEYWRFFVGISGNFLPPCIQSG